MIFLHDGKSLNPNVSEFKYEGPLSQYNTNTENLEDEYDDYFGTYDELSIKKPRKTFASKEE